MNPLYSALVLVVWFMSTFFVVSVLLILLEKRKTMYAVGDALQKPLSVSIILPAYDEAESIYSSLKSLYEIEYPHDLYEVIVVNDGSKDETSDAVERFLSDHPEFKVKFIDRKENRGKACSLNEGIAAAQGELVACMDADSVVKADILSKTTPYFSDAKVASVSVRVDVREPKNLLEKIVDVEYSVGLSTSLKVLSFLDAMHVTPGPFSIYRRSVLLEIGGFDEKNITEDLDIAFRIQRAGYRLVFCLSTRVSTKVPSQIKTLYKQRRRWYSGSLITLWRHRDMFFSRNNRTFQAFLLFNYSLIAMGVLLFLYSINLYVSSLVRIFHYLELINFDVAAYPLEFGIDLLAVDVFTTFALTMVFLTVALVVASSRVLKRRNRENLAGLLGYLFFFVFYQIFWLGSIYNVLRQQEIKWR